MTVKKSIHVKRPVETTFRLFTEQLGRWWPLREGFSFDPPRAGEIVLEAREGGRFYERFTDGVEQDIGVVTAYAPPSRIVFTWNPRRIATPTEVEVRFARDGDGTRVDLEHRGWEAAGVDEAQRKRFDGGWTRVLAVFGEHAAAH